MQALYWRSTRVSTPQLVVVALLAAGGLMALELNPTEQPDPHHAEKLEAARLAERAFRAVQVERIRRQIPLDPELDPAGSGLIGPAHSPIVSNEGHLGAKQTTANPNFAAVFVEMLHEAGVREGDVVAANMTGSFPAMNLSMMAAFETLGVQPLIVSSVASSEYGATHPELTWLDMERVLHERDLVHFRSRAVTLGGVLDVARDHTEEGRAALHAAVERSGRPLMSPASFEEAVQMRLDLFDQARGQRPVAAYVNIGGGTASVGTAADQRDYRPGLNTEVPRGLERASVMRTYLERGVPVLHISHIRDLARAHGLPEAPVEVPAPGRGGTYTRTVISTWAILGVLALILLALYLATRFDLASGFTRGKDAPSAPEQMV